MTVHPWQAVLALLIPVAVAWVTGRYAFRSSREVAQISVESGAFARAENIYKSALERLDHDVQAERHARDEVTSRITALEKATNALEDDLRRKAERIKMLEGDFDVLVPELVTLDEWIEAGAPPPPPIVGEAARKIILIHNRRREAMTLEDKRSGRHIDNGTN